MNDPHVKALLYRVDHHPLVSYENAQPFTDDLPEFRIRIEGRQATVEPKEHFATAKEARDVVEPFLRAWDLDAALKHDVRVLRFIYAHAEVIDRMPTPGPAVKASARGVGARVTIQVVLPLERHPTPPPSGLAVEPGSEVEAMLDKWSLYKESKAELADTANFCLTVTGGEEAKR